MTERKYMVKKKETLESNEIEALDELVAPTISILEQLSPEIEKGTYKNDYRRRRIRENSRFCHGAHT